MPSEVDAATPAGVATTTIFTTPVVRHVARWLSVLMLRLWRWRLEGRPPAERKYVLVAAPHTSNWDLFVMLGMAFGFSVKLHWLGKHSLFRGPMGPVMRWLGGVPVDRRSRGNLVEQVVGQFAAAEAMTLAIHPGGTRGSTTSWKSGFYYIALGADVPIVLGYIDYRRKVGGLGPTLVPSGDLDADVAVMREFYRDVIGKNPERVGRSSDGGS